MAEPLDPQALDAAILAHLLERHPAPVHREDLARAFAGDDWAASVSSLQADGVLHREGALVLATAAAVRTNRLVT